MPYWRSAYIYGIYAAEDFFKKQGWNVKVETRGQVGASNLISAEDVAAADLAFIATDIDVDLSKFDGKKCTTLQPV